MLESPTFNESQINNIEARIKIERKTFDRQKTLAECPLELVQTYKDLFRRIDTLELGINIYELNHNKRKKPPRTSLVKQFTQEEYNKIEQSTLKWNQFKYLKQRHLLVELRREQFTLRDTHKNKITRHTQIEPEHSSRAMDIDAEIPVYPLGLINSPIGALIFRDKNQLYPRQFTTDQQNKIIRYYWLKKTE